MQNKGTLALVLIILLLSTPLSNTVEAAAGDLDASFGDGGKVITDFGSIDRLTAIAIQGDGKIVAVGGTTVLSPFDDFALARYNTDGSLDMTFGTGGKVITDFSGSTDGALDVAFQSDRRILASGGVTRAGQQFNFGLARYNPDGSLDQSFGMEGKVDTDFFSGVDTATTVLPHRDGKIVLAGSATSTASNILMDRDFALARYNSDGSLDTSFGNEGKVMTDLRLNLDHIRDAAFDSAGRIVVVGLSEILEDGLIRRHAAIARYNADGSLDTTFGNKGKLIFTQFSEFSDLAVLNDGKLLMSVPRSGFTLLRLNGDGSPDATFGNNGVAVLPSLDVVGGFGLAIQRDGKIVTAGTAFVVNIPRFALARFNGNGSPDATFGSGGKVTTSFGFNDNAFAVAIQCDGKIVAAGIAGQTPPQTNFALARYEGDGTGFDIILQDDRVGNSLQINSTTGDYLFNNCDTGLRLEGRGTITVQDCVVTLRHRTPDRNLQASVNTCLQRGNAVLSTFSPGSFGFTGIDDSNTADNTCACR